MKFFIRVARATVLCCLCAIIFAQVPAYAVVVNPESGVRFRLAAPIHNITTFKVWGSRFDPNDALPEMMTRFFHNLLKESPLDTATLIDKNIGSNWDTAGYRDGDVIIKVNLEDLLFRNDATFGSKMKGKAFVRMTVYDAVTKEEIFATVTKTKEERWNPEYQDILDRQPVVWRDFEKSIYWVAIKNALEQARNELVQNYTGYRIVGRIVAEAVPAEGAKQWKGKRFHITLGRNDSLKLNDVLAVTRASAVRTIDGEEPVMLYPQIVGKVRVVFLADKNGVVEVTANAPRVPIEPGDAISVPMWGKRRGAW